MKKHLFVIGICIVILVIPISSAVNVNSYLDDEANDNCEIDPLDEYTEIISLVWGKTNNYTRMGFSVNIKEDYWTDINIFSYTSNGFYTKNVKNVNINFFIGYFYGGGGYVVYTRFSDIAIGNIEW